jgi:hypothetical protein
MKNTIKSIALTLAIAGYTFSACDARAETIKKDDLPALRGGKAAASKNPIPTCFKGDRAKLPAADPLVTEWKATHEKHACAEAKTVYVCRAGANLSVRCE